MFFSLVLMVIQETQLLQASQVEDVTTQIDPTSQVASEHKRLLHSKYMEMFMTP